MDSLSVGSPAVQGPIQPGAAPLPEATSGLFGSGGKFQSANIMTAGSAVSAGFGAYGQITAGKQTKAQFDIEAGSYKTQAEVVKLNAAEQANILRRQLLQDLGSANASAAARGLDVGSGTPRQIQQESIANVGEDIAKLEAGSTIQASGLKTSAARTSAAGATAAASGYYKGAQTIAGHALK